jgi:hypothetical protein
MMDEVTAVQLTCSGEIPERWPTPRCCYMSRTSDGNSAWVSARRFEFAREMGHDDHQHPNAHEDAQR